jgi:hypothetical protein
MRTARTAKRQPARRFRSSAFEMATPRRPPLLEVLTAEHLIARPNTRIRVVGAVGAPKVSGRGPARCQLRAQKNLPWADADLP